MHVLRQANKRSGLCRGTGIHLWLPGHSVYAPLLLRL